MTRFSTQRIGADNPSIHPKKDDTPTPDDKFFFPGASPGSSVEVLPDLDNDKDWMRVEWQEVAAGPFLSGWMRRGHLDKELPPPAADPVAVDEFVRACSREEMAIAGSDAAHMLRADYLIALGGIESGFANFGASATQPDRVGPYHFSSVTWNEVSKDAGLTASDRFASLNQIIAASAVTRRDWAAFSAPSAAPGGAATAPFVPTYLDLFHAWLIGVPAAQEVNETGADATAMMGVLLEKHHPGASAAIMDAHVEFLRGDKTVGGTDLIVAEFVQRTTTALGDALTEAGRLLVQHFPEFVGTDTSTNVGDDAGSKPGRKTFQVSSAGKIDVSEVDYTKFDGPGDIDTWIEAACVAAGVQASSDWIAGYRTLCNRESSFRPNAINKTDSNARGEIVADGSPALCSRGIAQCIPPTFATFHAAATSKAIYDPVANIAASIQYVRHRYKVSANGSDLAQKVQQADPNRPGKGY